MKARNKLLIVILLMIVVLIGSQSLMAAENKINMNFKGADIRDVFRTIAELAEVNLVTDSSVSGNITIHLNNLTFKEALDLITQAYNLDYKWYENTVVVATPQRIQELYATIEVKTVDVKHISIDEILGILEKIYPDLSIIGDQRNKKLIFKGNVETIAEAEDLLAKLDIEKEMKIDVISIPQEKAEFFTRYLQKVYPELVIENDESGLFISGTPADLESAGILVKKLMEQFNAQGVDYSYNNIIDSIKINNVDAGYVAGLVSQMYPNARIIADTVNNQLIFNGSDSDFARIKQFIAKIDIRSSLETTDNILIDDAKDVVSVVSLDYAVIDDVTKIIENLYPDVKYSVNSINREIVLHGSKRDIDSILTMVKKVDTPRKQVVIEARIEEINTRGVEELGINVEQMSVIRLKDEDGDGLIDGLELTLADFIRALEVNGYSNTLANPRLMTLSGEAASLLIGDKIPIQVEKVEDGAVVMSIEYIDVGINLEFTPWVTKDNQINLYVKPQVSAIGQSIGASLPAINTRELETNIRLNNGETFVVGGLIKDDLIETIEKFPILGDIPILGHVFRSSKYDNQKTEVVIFITPYIIDVENKAEEFAEIEEERPLPAETEKLAVNRVNPEEKVEKPDKLQEEKAAVPVDDKHINPSVEEKTAVEKEKQLPVSAADKNPEKELQLLTLDEIREVVKLREPGSRPKDTAANKKAEIIVPLENKEPSKGIVVEEQYAEEKKETTEYEAGSTKPAIDLGKYYLFSYELTKEITIKELAELFNVQEELIQEANKGRSFSVGSSIYIPVDESRIYIINKGDTLWKIHKMFNVEIEDIKKLNNIIDETNISVGTAIVIPQ